MEEVVLGRERPREVEALVAVVEPLRLGLMEQIPLLEAAALELLHLSQARL
jgi:hypothetical protein